MPANRRELDSLVKRKTSTNLGSNRKKFNVNTTNIYSIQFKYGWFKMFSIDSENGHVVKEGMPEHRNAGTPEHLNAGTPECRNAGTPEYHFYFEGKLFQIKKIFQIHKPVIRNFF
jgi:hypothetical protein